MRTSAIVAALFASACVAVSASAMESPPQEIPGIPQTFISFYRGDHAPLTDEELASAKIELQSLVDDCLKDTDPRGCLLDDVREDDEDGNFGLDIHAIVITTSLEAAPSK
ncbi:MAG TPA: hypothetical protein VF439_02575 [Candidatus Paceibacterota bacterium]